MFKERCSEMVGVEEYINLLGSMSKGEVSVLEALRQLHLDFEPEGRLPVKTIRATDNSMNYLRALAEDVGLPKKGGVYSVFKLALLLATASLKASSPEELWYARELILRGWMDEESVKMDYPKVPSVQFEPDGPNRVVKMFKELVVALSGVASHSGVAKELGTFYGVLMPDPFSVRPLLKAIKSLSGTDRRTIIRWIQELYEWNLVDYYVAIPTHGLVSLEDVVEFVKTLARLLSKKKYTFVEDPERKRREELKRELKKKLGITISLANARLIMDAVQGGEPSSRLDSVIRYALFRTMIKYPDFFRFRLFKSAVQVAHRKTKPFAVFHGSRDGRPVIVEGYYIKDFVVSKKDRMIVRAFVFRAVDTNGEEVPFFNGLSRRVFTVYGDDISATDLLYRIVVPSLTNMGLEVADLVWFGSESKNPLQGLVPAPVGGVDDARR